MHPQLPSLPISDQNIVTAEIKLLGDFARNQPVRREKKTPPIDRRRLPNDPHLCQEVATVTGDHLRVVPSSGSSVDDTKTAFATAMLQTAEVVTPPRERRLLGRGWRGDAQGRSKDQDGDNRETSSLEAARG